MIENDEENLPRRERTRRETLDAVTTIVFAVTLSRFLHDGTAAAIRAVDAFKEVGLDSFFIGTAKFSGRNENVMLGDTLAGKLDIILSQTGFGDYVEDTGPIWSMTLTLRDLLKNA